MFTEKYGKKTVQFLIYFSAFILLLLMSSNSFAENHSDLKQHIQKVPEGYIGIYSKKDLDLIREDLSRNYILMNDIHFTKSDFEEGGSYYNNGSGWKPLDSFSGIFDGNGYTINGLRIYSLKEYSNDCGLFGHNSGTIKNLGMSGTVISLKIDYFSDTGGIAGTNSGVIENCYNTGIVRSTLESGNSASGSAGGIAGKNVGEIRNCYNSGAVSSYDYAGGIAGEIYSGGTVSNCYNTGTVTLTMSDNADRETTLHVNSGAITGRGVESVSNCYSIYLSEVHSPERTGVTYLSEKEMKDPQSFSGFDFQNIWKVNSDSPYPFPQLQNVAHTDIKTDTTFFSGGSGSLHDPYIITTKDHLNHVRDYPGAYYILDSDLTFTESDFLKGGTFYRGGNGWDPICREKDNSFFGYFDGNGHTISGIKMIGSGTGYNGLFGYNKGIIRDLSLSNGYMKTRISDSSSHDSYTGGIAGNNGGVILNCTSSVKIEGYYSVGGIAGMNYGIIADSRNTGNIHAEKEGAGGITGEGWDRAIQNCHNTGTVTSGSYAAGISAYQHSGTITDCFNAGDINADKTYAAGIVSYNLTNLSKCFNTGGITANGHVGGIAGVTYKGIIDCYNTGNIGARTTHYYYAGGITGESIGGSIERCYNVGCVYASEVGGTCYTGGITNLTTTVKNCYSIDLTGYPKPEDKGVLYLSEKQMRQPDSFSAFDFEDTWYIDNNGDYPYPQLTSAKHMDLHEENTTQFAGGNGTLQDPYIIKTTAHLYHVDSYPGAFYRLESNITFKTNLSWRPIGENKENGFYGCFDGNGYTIDGVRISVYSGETNVYAGFFGYNRGIIKNLEIVTRKADMSANSYSYFGGIVGQNQGTIINCHHSGWIQAEGGLGGIAGKNDGGIIADSYNTATLKSLQSGTFYLGGIAASCRGTIKNCYNIGKLESQYSSKDAYINGIVGFHNSLRGVVSNCYYLEDDSLKSKAGTTPLSLEQMSDPVSFSGFDFESVWRIDNSETSEYFYPQLRTHRIQKDFSRISLDPEAKMIIGKTLEYDDFSNYILAPHLVKWSSSDEKVATVDENGTVTGVNYGSANITATALYGNLSSSCKVTVAKSIYGRTISTSEIDPVEYTGKEHRPEFTIKDGETVLKEGIDYELLYKNNINAGTATILITGLGDYHGNDSKYFTIKPKPFDSFSVSGIKETYYDGTEQIQRIQIKDGETVLEEEKDYIVTYENNIEPGTATMTIEGKGNYAGSIIQTFKIRKSIGECTVSGIENRVYTGSQQLQSLTIKDGDKQLEEGVDFTVSYSNNINAGTAVVLIEGINDYYGTSTYNFTIAIPDVSGFKVMDRGTTFLKLSWNKVNHATGYQILNGSSIIKTVMGSENTSASITSLKPGSGYTFRIRPFVKDSSGVYYGKQSNILSTPTVPEKGKITKVTKKKRSCTVKWKKRTGSGYQLMRSTNSKFKKNKKTYKIASYKKCSKKMKKLKRKKTYYVKVRSYKTFGGKTVYGTWSKTKKFKIK